MDSRILKVCNLYRFRLIIFMLFALIYSSLSLAQVTVVQAISFGDFVTTNNDAQYDITINTDGSFSYDSAGFIPIVDPVEGVYDLSGFTPLDAVTSVTVTPLTVLTRGSQGISMVNMQETHDSNADAGGVVRVTIGGTARTNGNGNVYLDGTYTGSIEIEVNF